MKQVVKIALIEPQIGYLDVKESTELPLTLSNAEIRDITQKKGTFSKSIELAGTKNNNILLNNYYDINIVAGTFNINRTQKCQIILNGSPILEDGILQLVSIKKSSNDIRQNSLVEYTVLIKDSTADLYTNIGGKELTDLDFSHLNHTLNSAHIVSTFDNTVEDEYKYYLPYKEDNVYMVNDLRLGIFEKVYMDRIIGGAGFTWRWDAYSAQTAQTDKTIVPYTGDKILANNNGNIVQAQITASTTYNFIEPITPNQDIQLFQFPVEIQDPANLYSASTYTNMFYLNQSQPLTFNVEFTYSYYLVNNNSFSVKLLNGDKSYVGRASLHKNNNFYSLATGPINFPVSPNGSPFYSYVVAQNTILSANSVTLLGTGTINKPMAVSNIVPGDTFKLGVLGYGGGFPNNNGSWFKETAPITAETVDIRVVMSSAKVTISTSLDSIQYNSPVDVNQQIPKKVKQSDFVKQFLTRHNLFVEVNPDNPTELIFTTRDTYYDSGKVKDWTKKLAKDKDQTMTPVSNSYKKRMILTYKQDDADITLKGYKDNTNEIYGQLEYTFNSDYIKDIETKELIVSPVTVGRNSQGNILPYLNNNGPELNIKLALNAKQLTASTPITIYDYTGNTANCTNTTIYPLISHFDAEKNASFDLNFGTNDFYFYNDLGGITNNNLFNIYWRRTASQIDKGWIYTAYFDLNQYDIKNLKLNDKIQIGNAYYNINQVIDYKANKNELTKVELITVDDYIQLPRFRVKIPSLPAFPGQVVSPIRNFGSLAQANQNIQLNTNPFITQGVGNIIGVQAQGGFVRGNDSIINGDSVVIGDKAQVYGTKSLIIGDNNIIEDYNKNTIVLGDNVKIEPGLKNVAVFRDNFTATTKDTVYTKSLEADTINGIDVATLTAATSGNFCASGITTTAVSGCSGVGVLGFTTAGPYNITAIVNDDPTFGLSRIILGLNGGIDLISDPNSSVDINGNITSSNSDISIGNGAEVLVDGKVSIGGQPGGNNYNFLTDDFFSGNDIYASIIQKGGVIISSSDSLIPAGTENSVILGGVGITANTNNSVYVPKLNVGVITGTSIYNLGIDANGFVVTADTSSNNFCSTGIISDSYSACTGLGLLNLAYSGLSGDVYLSSSGDNNTRYIRMSSNIPGKSGNRIVINNPNGFIDNDSARFSVNATSAVDILGSTINMFLQSDDTGIEISSGSVIIYDENGDDRLYVHNTGATAFGSIKSVRNYTDTSDVNLIAEGNIPGINLRSGSAGSMSILTNYFANDSTSFITGTGSNIPSGAARLHIDHTNGNVGVGTQTPGQKLDVNGNAQANSFVIGNVPNLDNSTQKLLSRNTSTGFIEEFAISALTQNNNFCASGLTVSEITACTNSNFNMYGTLTFSGEMYSTIPAEGIWHNGRNNGDTNTAFGREALTNASNTGTNNTAFGRRALFANTTGGTNTAIGWNTLRSNTVGNDNVAVGYSALINATTAINNTAVGSVSMQNTTTGNDNIAIGYGSLFLNTSGSSNTAIGSVALRDNVNGSSNVAVGIGALRHISLNSSNNISLGVNTGRFIVGGANLTASTSSIYIGNNARASANGLTNETVIGFNAVGNGSNTSTIGSSATTAVYLKGRTNLQTITGTSIAALGIDSSGFIVTATTVVGVQKIVQNVSFTAGTNNVVHNLNGYVDATYYEGGTTVVIPNAISYVDPNTISVNVTSATSGRMVIIG